MTIDKTTGRGCAWSIVSKTIAKRLIAEGIIGKTIFQKHRTNSKNRYTLTQVVKYGEEVYIVLRRNRDLAEEPLWIPSFIDERIWEQGVSSFSDLERLDINIEKHLLPEMGEYLQSIPDAELVSMTKGFLVEHGVINTPICQRLGKTYYFNENEVYSLDKKSELFPYEGRIKFNIFSVKGETCFNMNVWRKAASQFGIGMSLKECIGIFLQTELSYSVPQEQSPVDWLVQSIVPPIYERDPENDNESTFDRIRITVGLPRYRFASWENLRDEVKKYQREIYQRVIQKLEKNRQFKRYGIPINVLKLSNVMLLRDFSIEFIFELKE